MAFVPSKARILNDFGEVATRLGNPVRWADWIGHWGARQSLWARTGASALSSPPHGVGLVDSQAGVGSAAWQWAITPQRKHILSDAGALAQLDLDLPWYEA